MIPHLTLCRGWAEYIIIRMDDEFHIIDINEALTKEKRAAILESGCTPAEMQEMGLSGMTIPKADIKALTVTGCDAMESLVFHLRKETLRFCLADGCEPGELDNFFRDIRCRSTRRRKRLLVDWRIREQDPEVFAKLLKVGIVWYLVCTVVALWPLFLDYTMAAWGWAVAAVSLSAVVLDARFPAYFTILPRSKADRLRGRTRVIPLTYGLIGLLGMFWLWCKVRYFIIGLLHAVPAALGLSLLIGLVLLRFCREFTEGSGTGWKAMLVVLFLSLFAFVPHLNHVLKPELQPQTGTIVGKYELINKTGGSDRFIVQLPDGRRVHVHVSWMDFEEYGPGDTRDLLVGTGFFGIDYAIDG